MDELVESGAARSDSEWEQRWRSVTPDDICTFIYTSGTTGPPKGCVISHGNYRSMVDMALDESVLERDSTTYLFLPLAHSFALLIQFLSFDLGGNIAYWERDPLKIVPNLAEVKPDLLPLGAADLREDLHGGDQRRREGRWAEEARLQLGDPGRATKVRERERAGKRVGWLLRKQYEFADKQVLSKIRGLFGGRLKNSPSPAPPRSTPTSCASSTPPACWCSRAGG